MAKNAKNYTQLSKNVLDTEGMKKSSMNFFEMIEKKNISNIFLIVATVAFVISISYSITVRQNTQSSQASGIDQQVASDNPVVTQVPEYEAPLLPEFPQSYKESPIPQELLYTGRAYYSESSDEARDKIVFDTVIKYYVYHDIIAEQEIPLLSATNGAQIEQVTSPAELFQSSEIISFSTIAPIVRDYEYTIKRNLIQNRDYYYLLARYVQNNKEADEEIVKELGKPQKETALETITKYQENLSEEPETVETILNNATEDDILTLLNGTSTYEENVKTTYTRQDELLPGNDSFNSFLFDVPENQVSDVYEYSSPLGKKMGYIIVLPTRVVSTDYENENQLISEYIDFFE